MIDMDKFSLTKHDDELLDIIKPVKQYSGGRQIPISPLKL